MVTITKTARELADLAEKSIGYNPTLTEGGKTWEAKSIKFRRTRTGRRNRGSVEMNLDGRRAVFNGDTILSVVD